MVKISDIIGESFLALERAGDPNRYRALNDAGEQIAALIKDGGDPNSKEVADLVRTLLRDDLDGHMVHWVLEQGFDPNYQYETPQGIQTPLDVAAPGGIARHNNAAIRELLKHGAKKADGTEGRSKVTYVKGMKQTEHYERVRAAVDWAVDYLQLRQHLTVAPSEGKHSGAVSYSEEKHRIEVPTSDDFVAFHGKSSLENSIFHELAHARQHERGQMREELIAGPFSAAEYIDEHDELIRDNYEFATRSSNNYLYLETWRGDGGEQLFLRAVGHELVGRTGKFRRVEKRYRLEPADDLAEFEHMQRVVRRGPVVDETQKGWVKAYNELLPWEVDANRTAKQMEAEYKRRR